MLSSPASGSISVKSAWHPVVGYTNTAVVAAKEMTPFHAFSGPALNLPAKVPTNPPSSFSTGDAESTFTTPRSTIGVGSGSAFERIHANNAATTASTTTSTPTIHIHRSTVFEPLY